MNYELNSGINTESETNLERKRLECEMSKSTTHITFICIVGASLLIIQKQLK